MQTGLHICGLCHSGRKILDFPEQVFTQGTDMPLRLYPEHFPQIRIRIGINHQNRSGFCPQEMPRNKSSNGSFTSSALSGNRN
jgi:hypothetical protein